jgi:hypothetical protein
MLGVSATQEVQPVDPSSQDTQATANDDPPVEKPAKKIHKAKKPASKPATPVDEPTEENAEAAQE